MAKTTKSLTTLIKLRTDELDKMQARKTQLEGQQQQFQRTIEQLKARLIREEKAAEAEPALMEFLPLYRDQNRQQQVEYGRAVDRLEGQIRELQDVVARIFSERKKLEIAKSHIEKAEEAEAKRLEQQLLDEMGLQGFVRRES